MLPTKYVIYCTLLISFVYFMFTHPPRCSIIVILGKCQIHELAYKSALFNFQIQRHIKISLYSTATFACNYIITMQLSDDENQDYQNLERPSRRQIQVKDPYIHIRKGHLISTQKYIQPRIYFKHNPPYLIQLNYMKHVLKCLDDKIEGCLVEAPTGSGKTLCLLNSVFGWLSAIQKLDTKYRAKVIYMSRCHAQLEQIKKQLEQTCYRPNMVVFGGRQKTCRNPKFEGEQINNENNLTSRCQEAVRLKKQWNRQWKKWNYQVQKQKLKKITDEKQYKQFQNNLKIQSERKQKVKQGKCDLFYEFEQRKQKGWRVFSQLQGKAITINDQNEQCMNQPMPINDLQECQNVCPYYYPSTAKYNADLILMPYNYILDKNILDRNSAIIENSILIFDEAHNIPQTARQGMSSELKISLLNEVSKFLTEWLKKKEKKKDNSKNQNQKKGKTLIITNAGSDEEADQKYGSDIIKKFRQQRNANRHQNCTNSQFLSLVAQTANKIIEIYNKMKEYLQGVEKPTTIFEDQYGKGFHALPRGKDGVNIIRNLVMMCFREKINRNNFDEKFKNEAQKYSFQLKKLAMNLGKIFEEIFKMENFYHYILIKLANIFDLIANLISDEDTLFDYGLFFQWNLIQSNNNEPKKHQISLIQFFCFNSELMFRKVRGKRPKIMIITSGTMSPNTWNLQTGIDFKEAPQCSQVHVVETHQTQTIILPKFEGRAEQYRAGEKQNPQIMQTSSRKAMQIIKRVCLNTPGGVIVIVGSKRWMGTMKSEYDKIRNQVKRKAIYESKQLVKDLQKFKSDYTADCLSQNGSILFAVCKGQLTQGIDFKGKLCRAVIVVGYPYPNISDPHFVQKQSYFDRLYSKTGGRSLKSKDWVNNEIIRGINQGIGRVIRDSKDYGIIFLLGKQYENNDSIAGWARRNCKLEENIENVDGICRTFFQANE